MQQRLFEADLTLLIWLLLSR